MCVCVWGGAFPAEPATLVKFYKQAAFRFLFLTSLIDFKQLAASS